MNGAQKIKHLYHRACFALPPKVNMPGADGAVKKLFKDSSQLNLIQLADVPEPDSVEMMDVKKRGLITQRSREKVIELNAQWMNQLTSGEAVLREKMTLFWHDHFACRVLAPALAQQQNNTLRKHALGKFGDLLMAISKDAAMIRFLNNQQNKKDSPNENFAREVLELFTLGRGHYSENDIKNAARAFTGWTFDPKNGGFVFRPRIHDDDLKTFRGKTGNFTGEDIINMVLEDKQTSRFITEKIWRFMVSPDQVDQEIMISLADQFYQSDYSIEMLLRNMFSSSWFYDNRFTGNRIKSPVELLSGMIIQTQGSFEDPESAIFIQKALGQILFIPPNVGGWPNGTEWIDSSSLTFRMALPSFMFRKAETDIEAKNDGDANNVANQTGRARRLVFKVDWEGVANRWRKSNVKETLEEIEDFLLARPATDANRKMIAKIVGSTKDTEFVKNAFIGFMSLPEYQLS
ncbi:MAG: DUF1800 domain-containing protein [Bacteroidota bacterium]